MAVRVHKYAFFMTSKGIKTYRVKENCEYENVLFKGEELYRKKDLNDFFMWFFEIAKIARDDKVDFCFLSEAPMEEEFFSHLKKPVFLQDSISSWNMDEIVELCCKEMGNASYEIMTDENNHFQSSLFKNYGEKETVKIYLQCIPKFDQKNKNSSVQEEKTETSILAQFFIDMLNERKQ